MRRRPNIEQRRRELCDAAIELLATDGIKGLTHLKVDRKLSLPDGTTSFYFRSRAALVHAAAARVADLDLKELTAATQTQSVDDVASQSEPSGLAILVARSATGALLARTKARYELMLEANRDPKLASAFNENLDRFASIIRHAVLRLQPAGARVDPALVDERCHVVMMYINGLMLATSVGDRYVQSAEQLDLILRALVAAREVSPL